MKVRKKTKIDFILLSKFYTSSQNLEGWLRLGVILGNFCKFCNGVGVRVRDVFINLNLRKMQKGK